MTKLLELAIEKVRRLSAVHQDIAAECLLSVVAQGDDDAPQLSGEQVEEIRRRQGDRRYATDEEVTAFFNKMSP